MEPRAESDSDSGAGAADPADFVRETGWSAPYGVSDPGDEVIESVVAAVPKRRWGTLAEAVADYRRAPVPYVWAGGESSTELVDGEPHTVHHAGYVNYDPTVQRIGDLVAEMGLLVPCDASEWLPPGIDALDELRVAPIADVLRYLSSAIRGDRFFEGIEADAIGSGVFDVLLDRVLSEAVDEDAPMSWLDERLQVASDSRRVAQYRLLQSWYRDQRLHARPGGAARKVGSMLHEDDVKARPELNFLNGAAHRHAVRRAAEVQFEGGTLLASRLHRNMLSSMPLCFNIFGYLGGEPAFVELVRLVDPAVATIREVVCEKKPTTSLGDRTAFDALVTYSTAAGERRFLGVETKYTEPFSQKRYHRTTYDETTRRSGWFKPGAEKVLVEPATNQLWRNLLLAACTERDHGYEFGRVLVLTTKNDATALAAVERTRGQLVEPTARLPLICCEDLVAFAKSVDDPVLTRWATAFETRYLNLAPIGGP